MTIRTIEVRERVMARNDEFAATVRRRLRSAGVSSINLISSPGAGKTTLLERTLKAMGDELPMAIVTGDVQTRNDAERLARHTDRLVHAVVTGGGCHLDARQMLTALAAINLAETGLVIIENVGNLVCPAGWDLGEEAKVVLLSVTEGEDKPQKYPAAFRAAQYAVLTKIDLLPYVPFDVDRARALALEVNPDLQFLQLSALTGHGMAGWFDLLRSVAKQPALV